MSVIRSVLAALAMCGLCLAAHAQTRGWLRYVDGNLLSGELVAQHSAGGVFKSDRFGLLNFSGAEARFEAEPAPAVAAPPRPAARRHRA